MIDDECNEHHNVWHVSLLFGREWNIDLGPYLCNPICFSPHGLLKQHVICRKINVPCDGPRKNVAHERVGLDIIEIRIMKNIWAKKS
jgi:hypothetical protein